MKQKRVRMIFCAFSRQGKKEASTLINSIQCNNIEKLSFNINLEASFFTFIEKKSQCRMSISIKKFPANVGNIAFWEDTNIIVLVYDSSRESYKKSELENLIDHFLGETDPHQKGKKCDDREIPLQANIPEDIPIFFVDTNNTEKSLERENDLEYQKERFMGTYGFNNITCCKVPLPLYKDLLNNENIINKKPILAFKENIIQSYMEKEYKDRINLFLRNLKFHRASVELTIGSSHASHQAIKKKLLRFVMTNLREINQIFLIKRSFSII